MQMPNFLSQHSENVSITSPVAKVAAPGLLAGLGWIGVSSWADVSALLSAILALLVLLEWNWRKWLRPYCERKGWVKRIRRRHTDCDTDRFGYPPK